MAKSRVTKSPAAFIPATKAETGHHKNIEMARFAEILGEEIAERVK